MMPFILVVGGSTVIGIAMALFLRGRYFHTLKIGLGMLGMGLVMVIFCALLEDQVESDLGLLSLVGFILILVAVAFLLVASMKAREEQARKQAGETTQRLEQQTKPVGSQPASEAANPQTMPMKIQAKKSFDYIGIFSKLAGGIGAIIGIMSVITNGAGDPISAGKAGGFGFIVGYPVGLLVGSVVSHFNNDIT